ncbi:hypothetical protein B0H11DRAFT_1905277 [Mycena galericulata]|nr:hypothetical protein B0H11DRAFT_1905277 [Mycena galericulata]
MHRVSVTSDAHSLLADVEVLVAGAGSEFPEARAAVHGLHLTKKPVASPESVMLDVVHRTRRHCVEVHYLCRQRLAGWGMCDLKNGGRSKARPLRHSGRHEHVSAAAERETTTKAKRTLQIHLTAKLGKERRKQQYVLAMYKSIAEGSLERMSKGGTFVDVQELGSQVTEVKGDMGSPEVG